MPAVRAVLADWRAWLNADEQARVDRKRREPDRERELASRGAVRGLLAAYVERSPAGLAFATEARGKPVLASGDETPRWEFNASHSGDWVLVGIGRGHALGVDVEQQREIESDELVQGFFTPDEKAQWAEVPAGDRETVFFATWTRKEAYLKALGVGLMKPLDSFAVQVSPERAPALLWCAEDAAAAANWRLWDVAPETGYAATVVTRSEVRRVRTFTLAPSS